MQQVNLFKPKPGPKRSPNIGAVRRSYDAANRAAAQVILEDTAKYGGEGSGAVQWARLCLKRLATDEAISDFWAK
jgi:hypothetical protein